MYECTIKGNIEKIELFGDGQTREECATLTFRYNTNASYGGIFAAREFEITIPLKAAEKYKIGQEIILNLSSVNTFKPGDFRPSKFKKEEEV